MMLWLSVSVSCIRYSKGANLGLKCVRMRLAAGLRPDPLGELERSPRPHSRNWGVPLLRGREGKGSGKREGNGKREGKGEREKGKKGEKGRKGMGREGRGRTTCIPHYF